MHQHVIFQHSRAKRGRVIDDSAARTRLFGEGDTLMLSSQSWVDQTTPDLEGTWGSYLRFQGKFDFQIYCSVSERERVKGG